MTNVYFGVIFLTAFMTHHHHCYHHRYQHCYHHDDLYFNPVGMTISILFHFPSCSRNRSRTFNVISDSTFKVISDGDSSALIHKYLIAIAIALSGLYRDYCLNPWCCDHSHFNFHEITHFGLSTNMNLPTNFYSIAFYWISRF